MDFFDFVDDSFEFVTGDLFEPLTDSFVDLASSALFGGASSLLQDGGFDSLFESFGGSTSAKKSRGGGMEFGLGGGLSSAMPGVSQGPISGLNTPVSPVPQKPEKKGGFMGIFDDLEMGDWLTLGGSILEGMDDTDEELARRRLELEDKWRRVDPVSWDPYTPTTKATIAQGQAAQPAPDFKRRVV